MSDEIIMVNDEDIIKDEHEFLKESLDCLLKIGDYVQDPKGISLLLNLCIKYENYIKELNNG